MLDIFKARPRLFVAATIVVAAAFAAPGALRPSTRFLIGWNLGALVYLLSVVLLAVRSSYESIQRRADEQDAGAALVLVVTVAAAAASLVAIGAELNGLKEATGSARSGRLALAGATILISWLFTHTLFGLHYAHDYYAGADDRQGLDFPHDDRPDYWDFLYFAFTMGAASQTSDVAVTAKRMRRFVLAHTVVSFVFNATILALAINVGASLI